MTRYTKLTAVAAAAMLAAPAFAAMTTDANLELDNTYRSEIDSTPNTNNRTGGLAQDGRVEFNVAGKAGDANGFVAGRGTLLIKKDGSAAVDDMWGQIGTGMADVKLGRFEATDLSPPGKDVLIEDGADTLSYRANSLRGRKGNSDFHAALTVNPGSGLSFELGFIETKRLTDLAAGAALPTGWPFGAVKGVRPVVTFAAGPVTVKAGLEIGKHLSTTGLAGPKFTGYGITVGGALEGVAFNLNLSGSKVKKNTALLVDVKTLSIGANATFGPAGVGIIVDKNKLGDDKLDDTMIFAAYSIPLFNTGATLTPAISHQTGKVAGTSLDSATSLRVRMNYAF
jgi:Porin-like glycoporin RafY